MSIYIIVVLLSYLISIVVLSCSDHIFVRKNPVFSIKNCKHLIPVETIAEQKEGTVFVLDKFVADGIKYIAFKTNLTGGKVFTLSEEDCRALLGGDDNKFITWVYRMVVNEKMFTFRTFLFFSLYFYRLRKRIPYIAECAEDDGGYSEARRMDIWIEDICNGPFKWEFNINCCYEEIRLSAMGDGPYLSSEIEGFRKDFLDIVKLCEREAGF